MGIHESLYLWRNSVPYKIIWDSETLSLDLIILVRRSTCIQPNFPRSCPALMSFITTSSSNFEFILDAALDSYTKQTGIDLTKHSSADKLQNIHSPEDVIQLLLERETAFKDYRDKYHKLIDSLRPFVQVVHAFSGSVGEAAGLVSSRN